MIYSGIIYVLRLQQVQLTLLLTLGKGILQVSRGVGNFLQCISAYQILYLYELSLNPKELFLQETVTQRLFMTSFVELVGKSFCNISMTILQQTLILVSHFNNRAHMLFFKAQSKKHYVTPNARQPKRSHSFILSLDLFHKNCIQSLIKTYGFIKVFHQTMH